MPPETQDAFRADFDIVQETMRAGVTVNGANAQDDCWQRWVEFCAIHNIDPCLTQCTDPIPFLQVFGQRCRDGHIAPSQRQVKSRTVEDAT